MIRSQQFCFPRIDSPKKCSDCPVFKLKKKSNTHQARKKKHQQTISFFKHFLTQLSNISINNNNDNLIEKELKELQSSLSMLIIEPHNYDQLSKPHGKSRKRNYTELCNFHGYQPQQILNEQPFEIPKRNLHIFEQNAENKMRIIMSDKARVEQTYRETNQFLGQIYQQKLEREQQMRGMSGQQTQDIFESSVFEDSENKSLKQIKIQKRDINMMEEEQEEQEIFRVNNNNSNDNNNSERNSPDEEEVAQKIYSYYEQEKEALRIAHTIRQHKMCVEQ